MGDLRPLLKVDGLAKHFVIGKKKILKAVDGVSFEIQRGETFGLVGESGCGKTTAGRTILRLVEPTSGQVIFNGKDVTKASRRGLKELRKDMQIIFQDPFSSLNPRMRICQLIAEPLKLNKIIKGSANIQARVLELMETVGLARRLYNSYPHELDGGRRQRIGIARALALQPKFIVCDEPVSALDVSIQAQILNLLKDLQGEFGLTYIFITHNLSVVNHFADDIAVMYLGSIVEKAPVNRIFDNTLHPYTKALLSAIPVPELTKEEKEDIILGEITSPINLPNECRFYNRCPIATPECAQGIPKLREVTPNHFVACFKVQPENKTE